MSNNNNEPRTNTIAETENFLAWKAEEPDGEVTYHIEMNNVTVHFFEEEWTEFLQLVQEKHGIAALHGKNKRRRMTIYS